MKKLFTFLSAGLLLAVASAFTIQSIINWKIDNEKAMVKFTMKAHGKELIGNFKGAKGEVKFDEKDLDNSSVNCTIDVSTVNTGMQTRDNHLQAPEWFDVAANPLASFVSTKITKADNGFVATGNLTLKGIMKEVTIPFTYEGTKEAGVFKGEFAIKRLDYNIGKQGEDPGNDVILNLEIPVTKQ
jgi:polyisoprenoid-binding protein YceI